MRSSGVWASSFGKAGLAEIVLSSLPEHRWLTVAASIHAKPAITKKEKMRPTVYIIAGPNGVGKTTFARKYLPRYAHSKNFINADLIAQGISPFAPEAVALRAGRLMIEEIELFANRGIDFAFETTLSGRGHINTIRKLKNRGYAIHLFFLWVPNVNFSLSRVRERVAEGGHDVPEADVRRRFERSIRNFLQHYRQLADMWTLFDNSYETPEIIAFQKQAELGIIKPMEYDGLVALYGGA